MKRGKTRDSVRPAQVDLPRLFSGFGRRPRKVVVPRGAVACSERPRSPLGSPREHSKMVV